MKCPNCQFENPDNTRFCGNCATPLLTPTKQAKNGTETFPAYFVHLVPGKVFGGRFQIIEEIGAGGMGRVYKALDLKVNETIALKLIHPEIARRWFTPANMVMLSPVPLATAAAIGALWLSLERRLRYAPFLLAALIFLLCYTGLAVSLFPYIIPPSITLWQAAAAPESQLFMLYGAIPILPIILGYTAYSYYVFWDATEHEGYH